MIFGARNAPDIVLCKQAFAMSNRKVAPWLPNSYPPLDVLGFSSPEKSASQIRHLKSADGFRQQLR